jgi:hypothetical protein
MAIKALANLGPRAALRLPRPYALDSTLNFRGPGSLNVIFRLAVKACQQFRGKLGSFGRSQPQRVAEKIACRLTHGVRYRPRLLLSSCALTQARCPEKIA